MEIILKRWTDALLEWLGLTSADNRAWDQWVAFALVVLLVVAFDILCRWVVVRGVNQVVRRTKVTWDDEIFGRSVLNHLCHIVSALILLSVVPVVFVDKNALREILLRLTHTYVVVCVLFFVNAVLAALFRIMSVHPAWLGKPIKGLRQTAQGINLLIGSIIIISILIDKSPAKLLTGLGASAAIILLIFKDSILGFVSGIQLSSNDMVKVGDWISVPKFGADGRVEEVSLSTVKIRNWDNTIVTLPPYMLVSDSFQNWRAMQLSGGRRVMRSVLIDVFSVRYCTPEMLQHYRGIDLVREYIDRNEEQQRAYNSQHTGLNGRHLTNLGLFRIYALNYLRREVAVNKDMMIMVRQLQPTDTGIPVELYFFTDTVDWVAYEGIQSEVFEHMLAAIPEFDLRAYQRPSGSEIESLRLSRIVKGRASKQPE